MTFALSGLSVWIDHLLRAFWPVLSGLFLLLGFILWGITSFIPEGVLQIAFFLIIFLGAAYGAARFVKPTSRDIEKRLVRANNLPFDPFRVLRDRPAHNMDQEQEREWQELVTTSAFMIKRLWPTLPKPDLKRDDKRGLRFLALAVLCAGLLHTGGDSGRILKQTLIPEQPSLIQSAKLDLWMIPPEYTGLSPIHISETSDTPVSLPEGTKITAYLDKGFLTPTLVTNTASYKFADADGNGYTAEYTLNAKDRVLKVKSGLITHVKIYLIHQPDIKPVISIVEGPENTENNTLAFRFVGRDDYGLKDVQFVMRPDPMISHRLNNPDPFIQTYDLGGEMFTDQQRTLTLYDHPWAGLPVEIKLVATDTKGQTADSDAVYFVLPEKTFTHPLARRLAEIRKELFWNADQDSFRIFAAQMFTLQTRMEAYNGDLDIFMGLGTAGYRLLYMKDGETENMASLRQLLWDMALRIEGGSSRVAAENLQNTLAEIMQALQNPSLSEEQFAQLQQKLEKALADYMQSLMNELAAQLQQQGVESLPEGFKDMVQQEMDPGSFMQQLQDTLQNGSREEIANALQQMQDTIEQMKNMRFQPMTAEMQQALAEVAKLKDLIKKQEMLLDETNAMAPGGAARDDREYADQIETPEDSIFNDPSSDMPPMPSNSDMTAAPAPQNQEKVESGAQAGKQAFLKMELGNIQQNLEEATQKKADFMSRAGRAMEDSRQSLNDNNPAGSIPHQERALRELKQGLKQQMQQMASGLGKIITLSLPRPGSAGKNGPGQRDPFGRKMGPNGDMTGTVNIGDEEDRRRIQDIRDKILDNARDVTDDPVGEDYFDRLLERF